MLVFYSVELRDRFGHTISARAVLNRRGVWVVSTVSSADGVETEDRFEAVEYSGVDALNMTLFDSVGDTCTLAKAEGVTVISAASSVEVEVENCITIL